MTGENIDISSRELEFIRTLDDFDLKMFLSEVDEFGWTIARLLLPTIIAANAAQYSQGIEQ